MFLKIARKVIHSVRGRRIAAMRGQPQWCRVPAGFWMWINPKEPLGRITLMGYLHSELVHFIKQTCRRGDVCVDIGANQGYIALHMARIVGREGRVVAIEAVKPTFERLTANIQRNHMSQVECIHRAAGDCAKILEMWYDPNDTGLASVYNRATATSVLVEVPQEPADVILARTLCPSQLSKLILIKIDVEGYEPIVLKGLCQTLHRYRPLLWTEKNSNFLQKGGFTISDIVDPLQELGYSIYRIHFQRNQFLGIPKITLTPADIQSERFNTEHEDIVAVVPQSEGWKRLQQSQIVMVE
jgi:FkbM family methyltransferase